MAETTPALAPATPAGVPGRRKWLVPAIIVAVIVLLALWGIGSYNSLVGQREDVRRTFANLQGQYQRRADLVPNLVSTVKGAANFEQETLTQVTEARSRATSVSIDPARATPQQLAQYQQSQGELSQALGRLLAVTENYPQLTATQNFQDLQVQLEGTENRIAVARKDYNDVSSGYNTRVNRFPTVIIAGLANFDEFPYFQAESGAQDAPAIDFGE